MLGFKQVTLAAVECEELVTIPIYLSSLNCSLKTKTNPKHKKNLFTKSMQQPEVLTSDKDGIDLVLYH